MTDSLSPLFRFVQVNDLHLHAKTDASSVKPGQQDRASWFFEQIQRATCRPDFLIGLGDLVEGEGDISAIEEDLGHFRTHITGLDIPFCPVAGNHDIAFHEGEDEWDMPFRRAMGIGHCNYVFEWDGLVFIALNNAGTSRVSDTVREERARWFERALSSNASKPKIVLCHVPLLPLRDEDILRRTFPYPSYRTREPEALELVRQHAGGILAVLSGHLHLTAAVQDNGVCHFCCAGLTHFPNDWAEFTVFADRIEVEVKQVPESLRSPAAESIHLRSVSGAAADSLHADPASYIMGAPGERHFSIPT